MSRLRERDEGHRSDVIRRDIRNLAVTRRRVDRTLDNVFGLGQKVLHEVMGPGMVSSPTPEFLLDLVVPLPDRGQ